MSAENNNRRTEKNLDKAIDAMISGFEDATKTQAEVILRTAKATAPKRSGALRVSGAVTKRKSGRGSMFAAMFRAAYAAKVHWTAKSKNRFLLEAVDKAVTSSYVERMSDRSWANYLKRFGGL